MFERATREKLRFATEKGNISVEDLWDFSLSNLNELAKGLNRKIKEYGEEDFLKIASDPEESRTKLRFEIIRHIMTVKQAELEKAAVRKEKAEQRQKLYAALERKREEGIDKMTEKQLLAEIRKLDE